MEDHRLQARPPRRRGLIRTPACCWQGANQRKKKWTLQRLATASLSDGIRPTTCSNMQVPVPSKWENVDGFLHFSNLAFPSKWSDCLCKPAFCPPKRPTPPSPTSALRHRLLQFLPLGRVRCHRQGIILKYLAVQQSIPENLAHGV